MANFTEKAIKTAFMALLNEKPLSRITVKDISDRCGINRNSFYYHYQDIPSLIKEILTAKVDDIITGYPSIDTLDDCIGVAVSFAADNKKAILHIYNSVSRDIFEQYLWQLCEQTVNAYIDTAFEKAELNESERGTLAGYHSCVVFGVISGWLRGGMRENMRPSPDRLSQLRKRFPSYMTDLAE